MIQHKSILNHTHRSAFQRQHQVCPPDEYAGVLHLEIAEGQRSNSPLCDFYNIFLRLNMRKTITNETTISETIMTQFHWVSPGIIGRATFIP